uniref:Uncharacterized protein n=1 Tax=Anser cygnoides TaxID=8845 RepID=A0A8B9DQ34_ANSCY
MASPHAPQAAPVGPVLRRPDDTGGEGAEGCPPAPHGAPPARAHLTVAVLCYINLLNYMDRFTVAGTGQAVGHAVGRGMSHAMGQAVGQAISHAMGRGAGHEPCYGSRRGARCGAGRGAGHEPCYGAGYGAHHGAGYGAHRGAGYGAPHTPRAPHFAPPQVSYPTSRSISASGTAAPGCCRRVRGGSRPTLGGPAP